MEKSRSIRQLPGWVDGGSLGLGRTGFMVAPWLGVFDGETIISSSGNARFPAGKGKRSENARSRTPNVDKNCPTAYGMAIASRVLLEKAKTMAVRDPRLQSYFDSAEVISLNNQARAWAQ